MRSSEAREVHSNVGNGGRSQLTLQCELHAVPKSSAVALVVTSGSTTCARSVSSTAGLSAQPPRSARGTVTSMGPGCAAPLAHRSVNVTSAD